MINSVEVIKYEGTKETIIGLFKEKRKEKGDKLFVFYALTDGLNIQCEEDSTDYTYNPRIDILSKNYSLNIPIKINPKNNRGFTIIEIADESQYDLIKTVVESLL